MSLLSETLKRKCLVSQLSVLFPEEGNPFQAIETRLVCPVARILQIFTA